MAEITVGDQSSFVEDGKRLVLALEQDLGIDILHKCGGNAMCTTCRVEFASGEPSEMTAAEHERLEACDLLGQARLSCQIRCAGEMTVRPLMTLTSTESDDAGPPPETEITPAPEWITTT